jgi:iron complex outermembrane receptor protein
MIRFYLAVRRYATFLMVFATSLALAQERAVSGRITSADDNSGVPGVNILEKGTSNGTVSDADGNYRINVGPNAVLVFSFVGYTTQEITVGTQSTVNVSLASDVTALSEVVVVGYGTQDKKEITSSVTSVKSEEFNKGNINDPAQLLSGKVAGLQVVREGADPSQGFNIRLRGLSSVGANQQPLIVIDGVIGAALNSVDPNDIATMDVLKDGSAAAIYGTRGSAGVILITTKQGKSGKTTVDYNGQVSVESIARRVPVLDAQQFRDLSAQLGITGGDRNANTNWLDEITRNAISHVHTVSLGGGMKGTSYRASVNFRDIDGLLKAAGPLNGTGFQNLNTRLNLSQKALNDKLTINAQIVTTSRKVNEGFADAFRYATIYNPTAPIRSSDAAFAQYGGFYQETRFDFLNPVAITQQNINERQFSTLNINVGGTYQISDALSASVNYSKQTEDEMRGQYFSRQSLFVGFGNRGLAGRRADKRQFDLFESTLNYNKNFGDLNVAALGGYSYQYFVNEGFGISAGNFISDAFSFNDLGRALDIPNGVASAFSYKNDNRLIAFFGRTNFNFKETYFLSASARYEGSSRFGDGNKWGLFPAVSAGVTLSNLIDIPAVNSLKVRAGFGVTGQQPNDSYLSLLTFTGAGNFPVNGQFVPGFAPNFNANPNLRWERKNEFNAGIDFSLFNSRLSGTIDVYQRITSDFISLLPVPVPPNLAPFTWSNGGELENSGIELALNYQVIQKREFNLSTGINFTTLRTRINDLAGEGVTERFFGNVGAPGQNGSFMVRAKEGQEIGEIFGLRFQGIGEDGRWVFENVDNNFVTDPADPNFGRPIYDERDFQVLGNGLPDVIANWTTSASYKNWDFNFLIRSAFGHSIVNQYRVFYEAPAAITSYNVIESTKDLVTLTDIPRYSSFHVERGDFVRLDNITVGYTLPLSPTSKLSRVRFFGNAQNLFTITGYRGADAEIRYGDREDNNNPLAPGIDRRNTWVLPRTVTVGVNVTF